MAARRTSATTSRAKTATVVTKTRAKKKSAAARKTAAGKAPRATLSSIAAQVAALAEQLEALTSLVRGQVPAAVAAPPPPAAAAAKPARTSLRGADKSAELARFPTTLLETVADLDRRGRHTGMVPIPDLRRAFLERGWTRRDFDERLLKAERDFVIDLKTANDPSRLAEPDLAIEERGRGHLQFVVLR